MRYKAPKCKGATKKGHPCNNRIIDGDYCWLHEQTALGTADINVVDPRLIVLVRCFKCPHCGTLTELR